MISRKNKTTHSFVKASAALLLALLPPAAAPAAPTVVTCAPTKLKVAVSLLEPSVTESSSFVTVPETHVGFTQGGSSKSCVIVRFRRRPSHPDPTVQCGFALSSIIPKPLSLPR